MFCESLRWPFRKAPSKVYFGFFHYEMFYSFGFVSCYLSNHIFSSPYVLFMTPCRILKKLLHSKIKWGNEKWKNRGNATGRRRRNLKECKRILDLFVKDFRWEKSLLNCSLSAEYVKTSWWLSTSKLGTRTEKIVTTNGGIAEKYSSSVSNNCKINGFNVNRWIFFACFNFSFRPNSI